MKNKNWTPAEDAMLIKLDNEAKVHGWRNKWLTISQKMNRTADACSTRMTRINARNGINAKCRRARNYEGTDVGTLMRAAFISIADRIAEQGLTAGILGDPPKGRSALDRQRAKAL